MQSLDDIALQKAADHPVLTKDVERAYLVKSIRDKDDDATAFLVRHNVRLIIRCVRYFVEPHDARYHDLIASGFIGLMRALKDFDLTRMVGDTSRPIAFSTYAVWWINAEVRKELTHLTPRPVRHRNLVNKYRSTAYRLSKAQGYYPNDDVVFDALGWDQETVDLYQAARSSRLVTLDATSTEGFTKLSRDSAGGVGDGQPNGLIDAVADKERRKMLDKALRRLPPEAEDIIRRHYGYGYPNSETYEDLARFYHRTRERVRQIENEGLRLLWIVLEEVNPNTP